MEAETNHLHTSGKNLDFVNASDVVVDVAELM